VAAASCKRSFWWAATGTLVGPHELDTPLTFEGTHAIGATLGSGLVMLFDDTVDLRRILLRITGAPERYLIRLTR